MRFLVDQNLSTKVAMDLRAAGHDVVHASDVDLSTAPDPVIVAFAIESGRIIISADTDFGTLLAASGDDVPSVLLARLRSPRSAGALAAVILANLEAVADDLRVGSVVVLEDERVRVRRLPLR